MIVHIIDAQTPVHPNALIDALLVRGVERSELRILALGTKHSELSDFSPYGCCSRSFWNSPSLIVKLAATATNRSAEIITGPQS